MSGATAAPARPLLPVVALGLGLAYLPVWAGPVVRALGGDLPGGGPLTAVWLNWAAVAVLLSHVLLVERRPLASLLLTRPRSEDLRCAVLLWGLVMGWSWLVGLVRPQPPDAGTATITALPVLGVVALVVTAAITEEILMKAYPIERITDLTGRRWLGVAVSAAVFVAPHVVFFSPEWLLYQGGAGTLATYALYLRRRNLPACMLLHLMVNAPILIPTVLG